MAENQLIGMTINKNYQIVKQIGSGAFGEIYLAVNQTTNQEYAIQTQQTDTAHPLISFEANIYNYLNSDSSSIVPDQGIPQVTYSGTQGQFNVMLMDLLGKSLQDLFNQQNQQLSVKSVTMLAIQMIERIEFVHGRSILHRDIKPDNFLMGINQKVGKVYLIDFGLSQKFIGRDGKHIPYKDGKSLTGTARYASINTHLGIQQSRRDDLEGLGYVLLYFLRGSLPWQNLRATNKKEKYKLIMQQQMSTPTEILCQGFPFQFCNYLNYCKNLRFEDQPDYNYLKNLFKDLMTKQGMENDLIFDWRQTDGGSDNQNTSQPVLVKKPPLNFLNSEEKQLVIGGSNPVPDPYNQSNNTNNNYSLNNNNNNIYGSNNNIYGYNQNKIHLNTSFDNHDSTFQRDNNFGVPATLGSSSQNAIGPIKFSKVEQKGSFHMDDDKKDQKRESNYSNDRTNGNFQNQQLNNNQQILNQISSNDAALLSLMKGASSNDQSAFAYPISKKTLVLPNATTKVPAPQIVNIKANR